MNTQSFIKIKINTKFVAQCVRELLTDMLLEHNSNLETPMLELEMLPSPWLIRLKIAQTNEIKTYLRYCTDVPRGHPAGYQLLINSVPFVTAPGSALKSSLFANQEKKSIKTSQSIKTTWQIMLRRGEVCIFINFLPFAGGKAIFLLWPRWWTVQQQKPTQVTQITWSGSFLVLLLVHFF